MAYSAKRSFPRRNISEAARLVSARGIEYAMTQDLSAGGMQLLTDDPFDVGTPLCVYFSVRREAAMAQKMERQAIVTYCRPAEKGFVVGIKFLRLSSEIAIASEVPGPF